MDAVVWGGDSEGCRLPIDNTETEQLMKQVAIGRKNWLFLGSVAAGGRMADLLTVVSSAVRNHLDVLAYVKDVLDQLLVGRTDYAALRPDRWAASHPGHIRSYRTAERRDQASRSITAAPSGAPPAPPPANRGPSPYHPPPRPYAGPGCWCALTAGPPILSDFAFCVALFRSGVAATAGNRGWRASRPLVMLAACCPIWPNLLPLSWPFCWPGFRY